MNARAILWLVAGLLVGPPCEAATVTVAITSDGKPVADAVAELRAIGSLDESRIPRTKVPMEGIIDQRHETFIPFVSLIGKGGQIVFTNNDRTMHQVYSFSQIKQFAFNLDEGKRSEPIVFDRPGTAAIGCNIHDQMITYVYVSGSPWAAVSRASGQAAVEDVPDGRYAVHVWHPLLRAGAPVPSPILQVSGADIGISISLALSRPPKTSAHMQMY